MIKLFQTSETFGDSTAKYDITMSHDYSVKEFITEVLTQKEWGKISVYDENRNLLSSGEYNGKKLTIPISEDILSKQICEANSHGGWSNMDYFLYV